jgi:hypothetical protein
MNNYRLSILKKTIMVRATSCDCHWKSIKRWVGSTNVVCCSRYKTHTLLRNLQKPTSLYFSSGSHKTLPVWPPLFFSNSQSMSDTNCINTYCIVAMCRSVAIYVSLKVTRLWIYFFLVSASINMDITTIKKLVFVSSVSYYSVQYLSVMKDTMS